MITSVQLHNFKNHRSTKISLGRMNVLVGPNGSGKTSVLQAIYLMSLMDNKNDDKLFQEKLVPENLATRGAEKFEILCKKNLRDIDSTICLQFEKRENKSWFPNMYQIEDGLKSEAEMYIIADSNNSQRTFHTMDFAFKSFDARYLEIFAQKISDPSYAEEIPPLMKNDGSQIASMLAHLMTYEPDTFQKLVDLTKRVIPTIRRIRAQRTHIQLQEQRIITVDGQKTPIPDNRVVVGDELVFDMLSGDTIPAHSVSEGTLVALGILTALVTIDGPIVMLLDDIDQGLHPWAQRTLMDILKELLAERDDLQIVLTTHSPYIVDEVQASDVWVFNTNAEGYAESAKLSDHPDAERALQILTTGEFLSAEGEEWVGKNNLDKVTISNA